MKAESFISEHEKKDDLFCGLGIEKVVEFMIIDSKTVNELCVTPTFIGK